MRILGIDPGLRVCGYAIVDADGHDFKLIEAGTMSVKTNQPMEKRLAQIADDIDSLFDRFSPEIMAVEELYSHYAHPKTAILMGHARGVIFQRAGARNVGVESYAATKVKKSLTGHGRATKLQMQLAIASLLNLPQLPEPADVADAIAIALCCMNAARGNDY